MGTWLHRPLKCHRDDIVIAVTSSSKCHRSDIQLPMSSQRSSVACGSAAPCGSSVGLCGLWQCPHPVSRWFCVSGAGGLLQHRAPWVPVCRCGHRACDPGVWAHVVPVCRCGHRACDPRGVGPCGPCVSGDLGVWLCLPPVSPGGPRDPQTHGDPKKLAAFLARPRTKRSLPYVSRTRVHQPEAPATAPIKHSPLRVLSVSLLATCPHPEAGGHLANCGFLRAVGRGPWQALMNPGARHVGQ
jgi:hypothetical protein